jgi:hypothetical protein
MFCEGSPGLLLQEKDEKKAQMLASLLLHLPLIALAAPASLVSPWRGLIRAHTSHSVAMGGTQDTPDRLIGHAIITCDVTQRFPLLDTLEHGCPC